MRAEEKGKKRHLYRDHSNLPGVSAVYARSRQLYREISLSRLYLLSQEVPASGGIMEKNRGAFWVLVFMSCLLLFSIRTIAAEGLKLIPGSKVIDTTTRMLVVCIRNRSGVTVYADGSFTLEKKSEDGWEIISKGPKSPGEPLRVRSGRQRGYRCSFHFLEKGSYRIVKTCFSLRADGTEGELTKLSAEFRVASPDKRAPALIEEGNKNAIYSEDTLLLSVKPSFSGDQMFTLAEKYHLTVLYYYHRFGIYVLETKEKLPEKKFIQMIQKLSKETGVTAAHRYAVLKVPKPAKPAKSKKSKN